MTKTFILGVMDEDLLPNFVSFVNENAEFKWNIILKSPGGENYIYDIILWYLNNNYKNTKIIASEACSNGFNLLFNFKGSIELCDSFLGMTHICSITESKMVNGKSGKEFYSNFTQKNNAFIKALYEDQVKEASSYMNEKDLADFKKGKDVYFSKPEMQLILSNRKNNRKN